jgi:HlyD family secretion protein
MFAQRFPFFPFVKEQSSISKVRAEPAGVRPLQRKRGAARKLVPYAIAAVLLAGIIYGFLPKPIEVESVSVTRGPLDVTVFEEGKTRIRHRYTISPPVSGFLQRVPLRAGARIEAGKTVLATIKSQPAAFLDPRTRAEAEARVQAADAARKQREQEIERARSALDLARKDLERAKDLKRSGAIATKDWDAAENQVNMLTRELHAAEFAVQVADFELAQARAALLQTESQANGNSEPVTIISPITGFVLQVFEESARVVPAGTQIMEVGDPTDLEAEIELLSSDAVAVKPGSDVSIEQWGGEKPLRGKVTVVEPGGYTKISALGVEEQRVKVRVNFVDAFPPGESLGDRFRVEARILTWHGDDVLQVPTGALFRRGGDWMTFVLDGGRARLSKVEIAHSNGIGAEIRSGLHEGQPVILHPPDTVVDGSKVHPRAMGAR